LGGGEGGHAGCEGEWGDELHGCSWVFFCFVCLCGEASGLCEGGI
jgi:hypothetical protein